MFPFFVIQYDFNEITINNTFFAFFLMLFINLNVDPYGSGSLVTCNEVALVLLKGSTFFA